MECGCRSSSIFPSPVERLRMSVVLKSHNGEKEQPEGVMENEGGRKECQGKASGQSEALCLDARQPLRATLRRMKQGCAYLLNQKHRAEPAGGVSGCWPSRQHPLPRRAHFESGFLPANSSKHEDLPSLALGRAE